MNKYFSTLSEIIEKEECMNLHKIQVMGVPLWRIVRFKIRAKYLNSEAGFIRKNRSDFTFKYSQILAFFKSFIHISRLLYLKKKPIENIVFAFPRLQYIEGFYMDKFTCPVIENSKIKSSCLVFQKPMDGRHRSPRYSVPGVKVVLTDFIEVMSVVLAAIFLPFFLLFLYNKFTSLCSKVRRIYSLKWRGLLKIGFNLSRFFLLFSFYYFLFKLLKPKRVFIVNREVFFPVISACKKLDIVVYEFQHGITHDKTPLYSGVYDENIDPDYFLIFGPAWYGKQFAIDQSRIVNIGWAYQKVISKLTSKVRYPGNYCLVISEASISQKILDILDEFAQRYQNFNFHIRLHPQESYTKAQIEIVERNINIKLLSHDFDSNLAVMEYAKILGENSTVLYEALSLGKDVGRLAYAGLLPEKLSAKGEDGFTYLFSHDELYEFMQRIPGRKKHTEFYFSTFDSSFFNEM